MGRIKQFLIRWKSDYDFRTVMSALISLAITVLFALYNGFLGVYHASLWHGTICVYYIVLALLRTLIIAAGRSAGLKGDPEEGPKKIYVISSGMLLFLNLCLVVPVSLMVVRLKPVDLTLIPAIAMATYTTYKIVMASVNLKRGKRSSNSLIHLLRTIGFIEALVSMLTLQNTLIMVMTKEGGTEMLTLSAITSAFIMLSVLALSVRAMVKGIIALRKGECTK